jgi:hypothetical protein
MMHLSSWAPTYLAWVQPVLMLALVGSSSLGGGLWLLACHQHALIRQVDVHGAVEQGQPAIRQPWSAAPVL